MNIGQRKPQCVAFCAMTVLSTGIISTAHAQKQSSSQNEGPLNSDRPGFSTGTATVAPGRIQFEGGLTANRQGDVRSYSFGELLVRSGLNDKTELRLVVPSYLRVRASGNNGSVSGFGDGSLGFKRKLAAGSAEFGLKKPTISVLGELNVPIGSQEFRSGGVQPRVNLLLNNNLSPRVSLLTNFNYAYLNDGERYHEFAASASFNFSLGARAGSFIEAYGIFPSGGRDNTQFVNGGFTYLLNNDTQIDASVGFGLGNDIGGPDFFYAAGLTRRF